MSSGLVALARGSLKGKAAELRRALTSRLTPAQRFVLGELLGRLAELEAAISRVSRQIVREVAESADPFVAEAVRLLQTIPGIGLRVAEVVVSEDGVDMACFLTDAHPASWAGLCPGNNESAGKRRSGQTTKGSLYLRAALRPSAPADTTAAPDQATRSAGAKGDGRGAAVGYIGTLNPIFIAVTPSAPLTRCAHFFKTLTVRSR
jgi:transposase